MDKDIPSKEEFLAEWSRLYDYLYGKEWEQFAERLSKAIEDAVAKRVRDEV